MSIHDLGLIFTQLRPGDRVYRVRTMGDAQQLEGPHEILKIEKGDQTHDTIYLQDLNSGRLHRSGAQVLISADWIEEQIRTMKPKGMRTSAPITLIEQPGTE